MSRRQNRLFGRPEQESGGEKGGNADRAVSETIGFVLVFGLITTTIAVTFTMGLGGLDAAQTAERDNNVERAFDVLHDNLQDVSRDGVPSRATEIRLAGGSLGFGDPVRLTVTNESGTELERVLTRPLVYDGAGDTEIVYENGAVLRTDGSGGVVLNEPDLLVGETTVVSTVSVGTSPGTSRAVGGDRTVLVVGEGGTRRAQTFEGENITLTHENTPRADAWTRYYGDLADRRDRVSVERDGDDVHVTFAADGDERVVIHETRVRVSLSN